MAATVTRTPELELDNTDAQNLAVPLTEIANLYSIPVTKEMRLYSMLGIACLMVYGPKVASIRARMRAEKAQKVGRSTAAPGRAPPTAQPPPPPAAAPFGPIQDPAGVFTAAPSSGTPPVADPNGEIIISKLN